MESKQDVKTAVGRQLHALVRPRGPTTADQCREMGVRVGNTIEGRETYKNGEWSEERLTLLWLGDSVAVWKTWHRNSSHPDVWRPDGEGANWTLDCREWFLRPNDQAEARPQTKRA